MNDRSINAHAGIFKEVIACHTRKALQLKAEMDELLTMEVVNPVLEGKLDDEICVAENTYVEYLAENQVFLEGNPKFKDGFDEIMRRRAHDIYWDAMTPSQDEQWANIDQALARINAGEDSQTVLAELRVRNGRG